MKASMTALAAGLLPALALAHPSASGHAHPHGLSALLGLDAVAALAFGIGIAGFVLWRARRGR